MKLKVAMLIFMMFYSRQATAGEGLQFIGGLLTEYVIHEASHTISSVAVGESIEQKGFGNTWNFKNNPSKSKKNTILLSGFAGPQIVSGYLLKTSKEQSPYTTGIIVAPLIHNTIYIIRDSTGFIDNGHNDFELMSKNGLKREITYPLVLIVPIIQTYILAKQNKGKSNKSFNLIFLGGGLGVNLGWRF